LAGCVHPDCIARPPAGPDLDFGLLLINLDRRTFTGTEGDAAVVNLG
jgi:hypothetical protein